MAAVVREGGEMTDIYPDSGVGAAGVSDDPQPPRAGESGNKPGAAHCVGECSPLDCQRPECFIERMQKAISRLINEKHDLIHATRGVVGYGRAIRYGKAREAIGENDDFFLALDKAEHMLWKYDVTCDRKGCHRPTFSDDEFQCELHR